MVSKLKKRNDELQLENKELLEKIRWHQETIDELRRRIIKQREFYNAKIKKLDAIIKRYGSELGEMIDQAKWYYEQNIALGELKDKAGEIEEWISSRHEIKIEKYTKAPKVNKDNTDTLWEPYRQKFNAYIADGKKESWAKNEIGKLIEKDGVWKKASKKDPQKIITRPDRATLHRQLVTNRK